MTMLRGSERDDRLFRLDLLGRTNEYGSRLGDCCRRRRFEWHIWIGILCMTARVMNVRSSSDTLDGWNGELPEQDLGYA
jgi:hypothetical protein